MLKCGKNVKCWDYGIRPCVRDIEHEGGCNPFSNTGSVATSAQKKPDTVQHLMSIYERAVRASKIDPSKEIGKAFKNAGL